MKALPTLVGLFLLSVCFLPVQAQHRHLGKVDFPTSCNPPAQKAFESGLALLHHMMYKQAASTFADAAEQDPSCAIAQWGIAMSQFQPLWPEIPSEEDLTKGAAAIAKARTLQSGTERERAYLTAVSAFFNDWQNRDHPTRIAAWDVEQEKLYRAYPDDIEAGAFYALSHLATASKTDNTFANQKAAGALLEELLAKAPEHPGLFHYTIHAYDNPMLAQRAVAVARGYDKLAPDVPHALHMPTHIFVRLGYWPEVISWNNRSANAAWEQPVGNHTSMHYIHALDYLIYAHLQQGNDRKAEEVLEKINAVDNYQPMGAAAYGIAASLVRHALERHDWNAAANLAIRSHRAFPWDNFPWFEAMTYYARGLGAARIGNTEAALKEIASLNELYDKTVTAQQTYWMVLVDAQRKTVAAWVTHAEGNQDEALQLMRDAADQEDSVDKHPVTPGAVLPARELLGDMYMMLDQPTEALMAYEASLKISPNRFNSLYGAGRAAEQAGNQRLAGSYYQKLLDVAVDVESDREALQHARAYRAN